MSEPAAAPEFKTLRLGLVQMVSGKALEANLAAARAQVLACAKAGAQMVVLPEMFAIFGGGDQRSAGSQEASPEGPLRQFLAALARQAGVYLIAGSIPCQGANPYTGAGALNQRVYAACFVYDERGRELSRYDKVHLFDADVDDAQGRYRESDTFAPGLAPVYFDSPWGRVGLAICYDLRFPEYFRQLSEYGC
ncbi:MAG: carbon-nitrogen hydrolase family protein, partial [Cellvibrionaceae bacterium]|nr:carbon-nitrogen hydrolase family protein [Cellvibrionaceae bacterium]